MDRVAHLTFTWWELLINNLIVFAIWDIGVHVVKRFKRKSEWSVDVYDPEKVKAIKAIIRG